MKYCDIDSGQLEFQRNENVVIAGNAPPEYRPGQIAWVISAEEIETAADAERFSCSVGTILYLVEYLDGRDCQVPEAFIKHRPLAAA